MNLTELLTTLEAPIVVRPTRRMTQDELESYLDKAADILRGNADHSEFRGYVFALLFYKRINDYYQEEVCIQADTLIKAGVEQEQALQLARDPQNHHFIVPEAADFASKAGKSSGEFCTPTEVGFLMSEMLEPQPGMSICDWASGSGGLLLQCIRYVNKRGGDVRQLFLHGQESNVATYNISRIIMNPPFSLEDWEHDTVASGDRFGRLSYGMPPASNGDGFHFLIQTYQAKNYFYAHAKQTSNLCTINSRELKNWPVPIPPMPEQEKMIDALQSAEKQETAVSEKVEALQQIKKSLLQNLLTGKIRIPPGAILSENHSGD